MKMISDKVVDAAKELPGFGWIFIVVTVAYVRARGGVAELTAWETLGLVGTCWLADRVGSALLDRLYDRLYGPRRATPVRWKGSELAAARDRAARALFGPPDPAVRDYATAVAQAHVANVGEPSLYSRAKEVAKHTREWEKAIAPRLDLSKATRAMVIVALAASLVLFVSRFWPTLSHLASPSARRLGVLGTDWAQLALATLSLGASLSLRRRHHEMLYEHVATNVRHLDLGDVAAPYIFDVVVTISRPGAAGSIMSPLRPVPGYTPDSSRASDQPGTLV